MVTEIFEYRRQARGPWSYLSLAVWTAVMYAGWTQGLGVITALFSGPALGYTLARIIENDAEGFRIGPDAIILFRDELESRFALRDIVSVTISHMPASGTVCHLNLRSGRTVEVPATAPFAPERLAEEFRLRSLPVWRDHHLENAVAYG
ncbi:hypothetical protein OU426_16975 [Frigidibacter sp. RF13]|uniref:hypothetical protein n=1 Tax=Frigidibacter sp. RF13 TaxID=2997340 RepID=UPI0022703A69|nr:hypothetical protein [Frigidibacter sp. RF13]MCY1128557.1 hypothetical protein [Frigidibacter sp. RF13]